MGRKLSSLSSQAHETTRRRRREISCRKARRFKSCRQREHFLFACRAVSVRVCACVRVCVCVFVCGGRAGGLNLPARAPRLGERCFCVSLCLRRRPKSVRDPGPAHAQGGARADAVGKERRRKNGGCTPRTGTRGGRGGGRERERAKPFVSPLHSTLWPRFLLNNKMPLSLTPHQVAARRAASTAPLRCPRPSGATVRRW